MDKEAFLNGYLSKQAYGFYDDTFEDERYLDGGVAGEYTTDKEKAIALTRAFAAAAAKAKMGLTFTPHRYSFNEESGKKEDFTPEEAIAQIAASKNFASYEDILPYYYTLRYPEGVSAEEISKTEHPLITANKLLKKTTTSASPV